MRRWWRQLTAVALVVAMASGCGYILHPDRRGVRSTGPLDTGALVLDILWLVPGIIPGVVALAVDFSTGAIHESGFTVRLGARERIVRPGTRLVLERPVVDRPTWVEVQLVASGRRVAVSGYHLLPDQGRGRPLSLELAPTLPTRAGGTPAELQLLVDGHLRGRLPCRVL